jgi:hypothetical protein
MSDSVSSREGDGKTLFNYMIIDLKFLEMEWGENYKLRRTNTLQVLLA